MSGRSSLPPMNGLRAFEISGRLLNFRAAGDELGVTQGAVAQQVRGLEAKLGTRLFERHARGITFTEAGRSYHKAVSDAFARLREATELLRPEASKVTVSVTPTFASLWLIPNLTRFTAEHPEIDLRILATERVLSFQADGLDLAVRQGQPPFGAQFVVERLFPQSVIAVASPSVVSDAKLPLSADELSQLTLLHDTHDLWPDFLRKSGHQDTKRTGRGSHFSQTSLSVEAALAGQGVALVSRFLVASHIAAGRLVQVVDNVFEGSNDFHLLARASASPNDAMSIVCQWFMAQSRGLTVG